jgi:hypothetical protein
MNVIPGDSKSTHLLHIYTFIVLYNNNQSPILFNNINPHSIKTIPSALHLLTPHEMLSQNEEVHRLRRLREFRGKAFEDTYTLSATLTDDEDIKRLRSLQEAERKAFGNDQTAALTNTEELQRLRRQREIEKKPFDNDHASSTKSQEELEGIGGKTTPQASRG